MRLLERDGFSNELWMLLNGFVNWISAELGTWNLGLCEPRLENE